MEIISKYFNMNAEGCSIRGKYYARDNDEIRTAVLCGHGFGGHKDNRAVERFADRILEKNRGAAIVTFDFPCHGDDVRKTLRLEDCGKYIGLMVSWTGERFRSPALYAYSTSFGGYLFLKYISEAENPFEKIALRCPAVNMYDVITNAIMTEDDRRLIARGKSAPVGFDRKVLIDRIFLDSLRLADITRRDYSALSDRTLILHGTGDEIVPFESARIFAEKNSIAFEPVEGADHRFRDPRKMDQAIGRIAEYFGFK